MFNDAVTNRFQLLVVLFLVLCSTAQTLGQHRERRGAVEKPKDAGNSARVSGRAARGGSKTPASPAAKPSASPEARVSPSPQPPVPVALVSPSQPEYMSGEANVSVRGNQNPIVRLGLAQNGVNVIEFPAADSFFMIHPGNSDLVSFDEETARLSKRSLVLRPGAAFLAPPPGSAVKGPSASISVQMQSGVVVTFLIYPVRELSQNAHRCVVMYNRDEVVAARKAAGLAVNLDGRDPIQKQGQGSFRLDGAESGEANADAVMPKVSRLIADLDSSRADERVRTGKASKKPPKFSEAANRALKDVIRKPQSIGPFSKANHGLSLAVAPVVDLDVKSRLAVVAVRNEAQGVLRVVDGNPEIFVETFDERGKTLQIEQVKRLYVESTSLEGKLSRGEVAYYAIAYEAPVLGVMQRLRVAVSQAEAADEPATAAVGTVAGRR